MSLKARKLAREFVVIKPDLRMDPVAVSPGIYDALDRDYDMFRGHSLVSEYLFTEDWPTWEQHPAGDEIVVLLSGEVKMILRTDTGDSAIALKTPGEYVIVPANTWHTAKTSTPTRMLFITPGEGTENRET